MKYGLKSTTRMDKEQFSMPNLRLHFSIYLPRSDNTRDNPPLGSSTTRRTSVSPSSAVTARPPPPVSPSSAVTGFTSHAQGWGRPGQRKLAQYSIVLTLHSGERSVVFSVPNITTPTRRMKLHPNIRGSSLGSLDIGSGRKSR